MYYFDCDIEYKMISHDIIPASLVYVQLCPVFCSVSKLKLMRKIFVTETPLILEYIQGREDLLKHQIVFYKIGQSC